MASTTSSSASGALVVAILALAVPVLLSRPTLSLPLPTTDANFHAASCPQLEDIVRLAVQDALRRETALAAGLLRIFFHDCFPQGCDASVFLKGDRTEQTKGPNTTLQQRALQLIEDIRAKVHDAFGPTVSCADINAPATRDAVVVSGGPSYAVPQDQLDSFGPAPENDVNSLPPPRTASVSDLMSAFRAKGLGDPADLVALSGAHTVGRAHCLSFKDRSRRMDDTFSRKLAASCSRDPNRLQNLDVVTPDMFDNGYCKALTINQGVFTSDMALIKDRSTAPIVRQFAQSQDAIFAVRQVHGQAGQLAEARRECRRDPPQLLQPQRPAHHRHRRR